MKAKSLGTLAAVTFLLTSAAGMQLSAREALPVGQNSTDAKVKTNVSVPGKTRRPRMDLAFCIDTTGSMQGEIDMVKEKVKEMVAKLASGKPAPDIRVGMIAFRDKGDQYVTRAYPFTDDIDKFVNDISGLVADGGGDGPEAVCEALKASVQELDWDKSNKTAKLLFLIGDAGPKNYGLTCESVSRNAIAKGIQINTIACEGLQSYPAAQGVEIFKTIAKLADGKFEQLAYRQEIARKDGSKSVIVRAGGRAYELDSTAAGEWKKGAKELVAAGKAKPMSMRSSELAGSMLGSRAAGGAAMSFAAAPAACVDRRINNLDEVLLESARNKAESSLKVRYEK